MQVLTRTYWTQKRGNTPLEYEDAFCTTFPGQAGLVRFTVADGASESVLSGPWARVLVKVFCREGWGPVTDEGVCPEGALDRAYGSWQFWKEGYLRARSRRGKPVLWYEEPGLKAGAFSTLAGLEIDGERGLFTALAMGDSCLFHVRENELILSFPLKDSLSFGASPPLLCSKPGRVKFEASRGDAKPGDLFFLMTDALSAWFIKQAEEGGEPWAVLTALDDPGGSSFRRLVQALCEGKKMRNDDSTLTIVEVV